MRPVGGGCVYKCVGGKGWQWVECDGLGGRGWGWGQDRGLKGGKVHATRGKWVHGIRTPAMDAPVLVQKRLLLWKTPRLGHHRSAFCLLPAAFLIRSRVLGRRVISPRINPCVGRHLGPQRKLIPEKLYGAHHFCPPLGCILISGVCSSIFFEFLFT